MASEEKITVISFGCDTKSVVESLPTDKFSKVYLGDYEYTPKEFFDCEKIENLNKIAIVAGFDMLHKNCDWIEEICQKIPEKSLNIIVLKPAKYQGEQRKLLYQCGVEAISKFYDKIYVYDKNKQLESLPGNIEWEDLDNCIKSFLENNLFKEEVLKKYIYDKSEKAHSNEDLNLLMSLKNLVQENSKSILNSLSKFTENTDENTKLLSKWLYFASDKNAKVEFIETDIILKNDVSNVLNSLKHLTLDTDETTILVLKAYLAQLNNW